MQSQEQPNIFFGYWKPQGLGQPARYLLEYCELPFTETKYEGFGCEEWKRDKEGLGFDFPNLPYLIDGDFKLTESGNEQDQVFVTMIIGVVYDFISPIVMTCRTSKEKLEEEKTSFFEKFKPKLEYLSKFLGQKDWCLGYITIADFVLCYILDILCNLDENVMKGYKNLEEIRDRFMNLDKINDYRATERFSKKFFGSTFTWSGPE